MGFFWGGVTVQNPFWIRDRPAECGSGMGGSCMWGGRERVGDL